MIWRYFAWTNQTLAVFTLWAVTVYLAKKGKAYFVALIPALFMTAVCTTYLLVAPECFGLPIGLSQAIGTGVALLALLLFFVRRRTSKASEVQ